MVIQTRNPTITRHTGFEVGEVDVRFGILAPSGSPAMADWSGDPQIARIEGPGIVITQILLSSGPRQITLRLFLETIEEGQALYGLLTLTGTLTLFHGMHTASVPDAKQVTIDRRVYDYLENTTLLALTNRIVFATSGHVEVDATFQRSAS